jgi:photosystem II stability/assembly factor-like uncharacterized protein
MSALRLPSVAFAVLAFACLPGWSWGADTKESPNKGPAPFDGISFRSIGPASGGRIARVAGIPGDPLVYYVAAASGGVWKSTDGGIHWHPIFEDQPTSSIGSIAVAPSDPNVLYVGSGEANIRGNVAPGDGIYKSVDGGKTWSHVLKQEGQIGSIVVDPQNASIAYAAVLGHAFGPNPERGVYKTDDGGKNWRRVLSKDPDTGASDVSLDPSNPHILFAGLWQARRRPWEMTSGGPGSGLFVSRDGGETWTPLKGKGLPEGIWGKIGVAVAPSDTRRVYALIEAEEGGLFRSDDGGESFRRVSDHHALRQRAWYYSTLTVDPTNRDVVYCPQVRLLKSVDGGATFKSLKGPHHGDHHDIWVDPKNPRRMIDGNDGGVDITVDGGETWFAPPLPIAQFYHVSVDESVPYRVSGAMQDLGTAQGPSNSLASTGIRLSDWHGVGGGEAGHTVSQASDPGIVYAGEYGGVITRYDERTGEERNVSVLPDDPSGHGAEDMKYRFQWTAPIAPSPHDPKVIYHGGNVLLKTEDGGATWAVISTDLTRNDKGKQKWSGGPITGDNTGVEYYDTIFAIAESPKQKGLVWVGTDDGLVQVTRDSGQHWSNVTAKIPGVPEWATVDLIEPSPFDAGTAYVVFDAHRLDDMRPYLYKTTDFGDSWKSLGAKLPQDGYLHAVREDPKKRGLLFLGTEKGVLVSPDDGQSWKPLKLGLPTVAVHDLVVRGNDLVLATHGRSLWILDDLTPIREMSETVRASDAYLFPPEPATRWHYRGGRKELGAADNPPQGAILAYYLKAKPKGDVSLDILDGSGKVIRTLKSTAEKPEVPPDDPDAGREPPKSALEVEPGVQRATWDLHYTRPGRIKGAKSDAGDAEVGPLAAPGTYTVRLNVEGKSLTQPLSLLPDPRVKASPADLAASLAFGLAVEDSLSRVAKLVESLRSVRAQLQSRRDAWAGDSRAEDLAKEARAIEQKCTALEEKLQNPKAQVTYDILAQKGGAKLYSRLGFLFDSAEGSEPPTQGMREVYAAEQKELEELAGEFQHILSGDVAAWNQKVNERDLGGVAAAAP